MKRKEKDLMTGVIPRKKKENEMYSISGNSGIGERKGSKGGKLVAGGEVYANSSVTQ